MAMPTGQPKVSVGYPISDVRKIASLVGRMRAKFGLSPVDMVPIFEILEFRITDTFPDFRFVVDLDINFDHSVLALTKWSPPEIVVRESVYQHAAAEFGPARVVLAHELGHLWLRHGQNYTSRVNTQREDHLLFEWQADEFAAELLMPSEVVLSMTPDVIAKRFLVPSRTAKARLQTLLARDRSSPETKIPRFEPYSGLLSRYEREVLKWVPTTRFYESRAAD
jgi:hypothetical protein